MDAISDAHNVLPWPNMFPQVTNVALVIDDLVSRVSSGLDAIVNYPTDKQLSRMKLAGALAGTAMLRYGEFARRFAATATPKHQKYVRIVDDLLERMEVTFAQEMWRRWALGSFGVSKQRAGEQLMVGFAIWMEAVMRSNMSVDKVKYYE